VASDALDAIRHHSNLVTHSIGAGPSADVVLLYLEDICGDVESPPRHARAFGDLLTIRKKLASERAKALREFRAAVVEGQFPGEEESVKMSSREFGLLKEALDKH
jgi:3-methyl-2-oxobutanoate hydroxymethyltransferase